ncbi:PIN-like domain-containing protein [Dactylosporangium sp. NPDC000244]|uniref:PIN-like domain-containing protein n=1 Tax=Dactylosporangium sp. NPDC000244 TaxID=3154365 RepID=UPI00332F9352
MHGLFDGFEGYRIVGDADKDQALKSALVAVDANVLLSLYRYNRRTTEDLLAVLERLGDRLVVPHQALREFHRNRISAIGNPSGVARETREELGKSRAAAAEAMRRWARTVALDDADLRRHEQAIEELFDDLDIAIVRTETGRVQAATPVEQDPVMRRLLVLLAGRVLPHPGEQRWSELVAEGTRRVAERRPPGYLDADKTAHPEGATGDFLIFRQSCEAARERGLDLVIVTNDEKEDWWWRHRSEFVGPRPELVKEFFDLSGRRLHLLRVRDLLSRSAALDVEVSPASVQDAERDRSPVPTALTADAALALIRVIERVDPEVAAAVREAAASDDTVVVTPADGPGLSALIAAYIDFLRLTEGRTIPVPAVVRPVFGDGGELVAHRLTPEFAAVLRLAPTKPPAKPPARG